MSDPVLRAQALEKRFGAVVALRGVDLELESGGSLAILGPNGAGKTTLLKLLAGLAHPTAGRIEIAGTGTPRARVGFLGHATLLYPELTARENLVFSGRLYGLADAGARADVLLAEEGLSEVAHRRAGGFSRGMSQRLSIARARVHDPDLLLLDEPFTGLDRPSADRLTVRLRALQAAGHSLVFVSHDVSQAAALADQALILVRGRVAHRSEPGSQLDPEALEHAYTAVLGSAA